MTSLGHNDGKSKNKRGNLSCKMIYLALSLCISSYFYLKMWQGNSYAPKNVVFVDLHQ